MRHAWPSTVLGRPLSEETSVQPTRNPASAVHGTVLAGALIAVQGAHDDIDISRLVWLVLLTQMVYWLAHIYAELVGERIQTRAKPGPRAVRHLMEQEWPMVAVSFGPLAVIVLCTALGVSAETSVNAGLWASVALLAGWALLAGFRSRLGRVEMLLYVAVSLLLGLALIAIKTLLH